MPTISKLIAAIIFAVSAYMTGEAYKQVLAEDLQYGQFTAITIAIGIFMGWTVMGNLAGRGYYSAVGFGFRTAVGIAVSALLIFSVVLMVRKAFRKAYAGPTDALVDIFGLAVQYGTPMLNLDVLTPLAAGAVIGGIVTEWFKQRWD